MGSVFKRSGSLVMEYRDRNGKTIRKAVGKVGVVTKTMAKEILKNREREVKLDQYDMLDVEIPILKEFSKKYIAYVRDTLQRRS